MTSRLFLILCICLAAVTPPASAETTEPGNTYALLIGGLGGQEPYSHWYEDWTGRFQKYLTTTAGVPSANVTVLTRDAATSEAITGALGKLAQEVKPQDQFILFITGHGEISGKSPTLMIPGPDLSADQLSAALAGIKSKNQVILNFSASSGNFLKTIAAAGRVNIAATSQTEGNEPVFAEFFLRGLESKRAGKGDAINMLDAYNWATQQTALWIVRWVATGTGPGADPDKAAWKASGKETVEIFEKLYPKNTTRKLDPASDHKAEDAIHEFLPADGQVTGEWANRRVVDEHAILEDNGQEIGVSALGDKGFQPILGEKPGDPGYFARLTVLGKPVTLPAAQ